MTTTDLSNLSQSELEAELKRRKKQQQDDRQAYKQLVADVVPGIIGKLSNLSSSLSALKAETFNSFKNVLEIKADVYDMNDDKFHGQQTHTFTHEGTSLTIGYRIMDGWDDTVSAGVTKVKNFIASLAKNEESAVLIDAVTMLLKPDRQGNLKASRVLDLKKLVEKHPHKDLEDGVDIIIKAHKPVRSNWFIAAKTKNTKDQWEDIPLSISSVDFPVDFDFNFLTKNAE